MNYKGFLIGLLLVFANYFGFAQDENIKPDEVDSLIRKYQKVMIIPFEPRMYLCPVNKKLAEASNKNTVQIVQAFRHGIAKELQNQFLYIYSTVSLIHMNDTTHDIARTYESISYKFEEEPEEPAAEEEKQSLFGSLTKKKKGAKKQKEGPKVRNGQLTSRKSMVKKFANVKLKKPQIIPYLGNKYGADLFVFITEMDLTDDMSDQFALQNGTYERILKFHFSMIDGKGKTIEKGVVQIRIPNSVTNVKAIQNQYFPIIAKKLKAKLPQPQKPNVDKKKAVSIHDKLGRLKR